MNRLVAVSAHLCKTFYSSTILCKDVYAPTPPSTGGLNTSRSLGRETWKCYLAMQFFRITVMSPLSFFPLRIASQKELLSSLFSLLCHEHRNRNAFYFKLKITIKDQALSQTNQATTI